MWRHCINFIPPIFGPLWYAKNRNKKQKTGTKAPYGCKKLSWKSRMGCVCTGAGDAHAYMHTSSYVTTIPPESPAYPFVWSETWCCPWNVLFEQFPSFWHWDTGIFVLLAMHFKAGLQLIGNDLAAFLAINPTGTSNNTDRVSYDTLCTYYRPVLFFNQ